MEDDGPSPFTLLTYFSYTSGRLSYLVFLTYNKSKQIFKKIKKEKAEGKKKGQEKPFLKITEN